jgi:hypothetical protein
MGRNESPHRLAAFGDAAPHITETRRPAALEVSLRSFLFQCQIAACSAVPVDCVA